MKSDVDKDTLGTKKPHWNQSVGIVGHPQSENHSKTLFMIKHGLKDETITDAREQKVHAGCDTRDAYYSGWNVSTQAVNPRDAERFLQAT